MLEWIGALGGILLVDLALSGDNALVIGAAAAELPRSQRRLAIALGGGGAIVLRIMLAAAATLLLELPLLQAIGGAVLLIIAARLLMGREQQHAASDGAASVSLVAALVTILVADVTMSLDNVLAIGALAHGNLPLLAVGLLLSMAFLLVGSSLVAELIGRLPWLLDVAALVLGWTAGGMMSNDSQLQQLLAGLPWSSALIHAAALGAVVAMDVWLRLRVARRDQKQTMHAEEARAAEVAARRD